MNCVCRGVAWVKYCREEVRERFKDRRAEGEHYFFLCRVCRVNTRKKRKLSNPQIMKSCLVASFIIYANFTPAKALRLDLPSASAVNSGRVCLYSAVTASRLHVSCCKGVKTNSGTPVCRLRHLPRVNRRSQGRTSRIRSMKQKTTK